MEIIFVRHGLPDYLLADERLMSQLEKDFSPLDRSCIPFIKQQTKLSVFDGAEIILSSPYTRALQTAEIINRKLQLELYVEHDLREWRADKEGCYITLQERDQRWCEYRELLRFFNPMEEKPYETYEELSLRVNAVLAKYSNCKKVVVVSHFNVIESLVGYREQGIEYGGVYQFNIE